MPNTVLITGGTGCIGSETCRHLIDNDQFDQIILLSRSGTNPFDHPQVSAASADITDLDSLKNIFETNQISHVLHSAAMRTSDCIANPKMAMDVNVQGTTNILEASRQYIQRFMFISTAAVYGSKEGVDTIKEDAKLEAFNPYIASKIAAEAIIEAFSKSYNFDSIIFRPQILFGPGRGEAGSTAGLNNAMRAAAQGKPFNIPYSSQHTFHYTRDVGRILNHCLTEKPHSNFEIYNLPGISASIQEMVDLMNAPIISITEKQMPFPKAIDASLFFRHFPDIKLTKMGDAVAQTLAFYKAAT